MSGYIIIVVTSLIGALLPIRWLKVLSVLILALSVFLVVNPIGSGPGTYQAWATYGFALTLIFLVLMMWAAAGCSSLIKKIF